MPEDWYEALYGECDDLWAPSTQNAAAFTTAGFPNARVAVVPYGVDIGVFNPKRPRHRSGQPFRFLYVGASIPRKGIDLLINAYFRTFTPDDNVQLTIKDVNAQTFYRATSKGAEIAALSGNPQLARMEYTDATLSDGEMARLYRETDCLVLPYRGEGFALPVLEAMACGTAVMVTQGGATDDFVDEAVGWRIPSRRVDCPPGEPVPTIGPAWLLECDPDALSRQMRFAYAHPAEVHARGDAAARRAAAWTWDHAAEIAEARLQEIARQTAMPSAGRDARYANARVYEERKTGSRLLDGVVLELFRRLTVNEPLFVEFNATGSADLASVFEAMRWNGVVANPAAYAPEDLDSLLRSHGVREDFDLLALASGDIAAIWNALGNLRPRAVLCAGTLQSPADRAAQQLGYGCIARETSNGDALYLRNDLVELAGFAAVP